MRQKFDDNFSFLYLQKNLLRKRKLSKTAEHTENQREARVFWMITAMTICYVMAWFPYASLAITKVLAALVERTSSDPTERIVINDWSFIAALLAKLSVTFNPIIYAVFNTQVLNCRFTAIKVSISYVRKVHL